MISFTEILRDYPELFCSRPLVNFWARKANPSTSFDTFISPMGHKEFRLTSEQFKKTIFARMRHLKEVKKRRLMMDSKKAYAICCDNIIKLVVLEDKERARELMEEMKERLSDKWAVWTLYETFYE